MFEKGKTLAVNGNFYVYNDIGLWREHWTEIIYV